MQKWLTTKSCKPFLAKIFILDAKYIHWKKELRLKLFHSTFQCLKKYLESLLTHFVPLISFCTSWKHQKNFGCMFSGDIERDQWHEMCYRPSITWLETWQTGVKCFTWPFLLIICSWSFLFRGVFSC